jgi:hypothetical protein
MCIYCGTNNYRKIYANHFGPIPKDNDGRTYDVHHKDGKRSNNHPDNLIAVTIQEHYNIHESQGDWYACLKIAIKMKKGPKEISDLARKNAHARVAAGTNPLQRRPDGSSNTMDRIQAGTFKSAFSKRPDGTSFSSDKVKNGDWISPFKGRTGEKNSRFNPTLYHFYHKDTNTLVIMTQNEFVKTYNLDFRNVSAIANGKRKSHRGWLIKQTN